MAGVSRAENERRSYNEGSVTGASVALHRRFEHVFTCPNALYGERYWEAQLARCVPGRDVLEIGCFDGGQLLEYRAMQPRSLVGIDISDALVAKACARGVDARVMDANCLQFRDAAFDTIIGRAVLHHLDYDTAIGEMHRVLRPGGAAIFMEPLRDNPAWKLFRLATPNARTVDELPLSRRQIEHADRLFGSGRHCFVGLASTAVGSLTSFLTPAADNSLSRMAHAIDRNLERSALRYWMRQAVLVWEKAKAA
jgi:SAM-dependent methyltransferase